MLFGLFVCLFAYENEKGMGMGMVANIQGPNEKDESWVLG